MRCWRGQHLPFDSGVEEGGRQLPEPLAQQLGSELNRRAIQDRTRRARREICHVECFPFLSAPVRGPTRMFWLRRLGRGLFLKRE